MATARNYSGPYYQQTMDRLNKLRDQTPGGPVPASSAPVPQGVILTEGLPSGRSQQGGGILGMRPAAPMTGGFAGGRTTGYGGTRNYEPPQRYVGYGGGSVPFQQVPVPAPAAPGPTDITQPLTDKGMNYFNPAPGGVPPQIAALLAMLGTRAGAPIGTAPQGLPPASPGLQTMSNGGYGMVPSPAQYGTAPGGLQTLNNGGYGMVAPPNIAQIQAILAMLGGR